MKPGFYKCEFEGRGYNKRSQGKKAAKERVIGTLMQI